MSEKNVYSCHAYCDEQGDNFSVRVVYHVLDQLNMKDLCHLV